MELTIANRIHVSFGWETTVKVLLCVVWASALVGYAKGIINRLPLLGDYSEQTQAALIVVPLVAALPVLVKRFCLADYLFYFFCVFYYLFCFVAYPENSTFLEKNALACICYAFPCYFIGRLVDIDKMYNAFLVLSVACIFMDLFYFLVYAPRNKVMSEVALDDNMYRAYQSLPHVMMLLWATLSKFRLWKCAMTIVGVLFLLSCGTRGPLVCLGFFGVVYFFFFMNFKGAIYLKGAIVAFGLVVLAFIKEIVIFLAQTFMGLNLSTRILEKLISGGLGHDSYRGELRDEVYHILDAHGDFFGLGVFGCQRFGIIYPHFLPLDFFCTYGYILGWVLLLMFMGLVGWAFWLARGKTSQVFILLLFSISVIRLMLSNTFLLDPWFYLLIGYCVREVLISKKQLQID